MTPPRRVTTTGSWARSRSGVPTVSSRWRRSGPPRSVGQTDPHSGDNFGSVVVSLTGDNSPDPAAVGAVVHGAAGETVTAQVGLANNGPARIDGYAHADIDVPTGTTLVGIAPSGWCAGFVGGDWDWEHPARPGAPKYSCGTDRVLKPHDRYMWTIKLHIDDAAPTEGAVVVALGSDNPADKDRNLADNTAKILVNPPAGATGPTSGGGVGGGLPVTGTGSALIALVGVTLVAVGAGTYLLTRRRRRTHFAA